MTLQTRALGSTGRVVTRVGLGGEGVLRTHGREQDALAVIREAERMGITYWDSAAAYDESEAYYGLFWGRNREKRSAIFQTSKSARRDARGARSDLERSLQRTSLSRLDLWQIHDLRTMQEIRQLEAPGGALEAFVKAREDGRVRCIGVTGHHDPEVLLHAVENWPLDTVLLPVNPVEGVIGGFLDPVIPAARKRRMGIIGMKLFGGGHYLRPESGITADRLLAYALAQDVDLAIVGCSTPGEVRTLAAAASGSPLPGPEDPEAILEFFRPRARDLAYYRGGL